MPRVCQVGSDLALRTQPCVEAQFRQSYQVRGVSLSGCRFRAVAVLPFEGSVARGKAKRTFKQLELAKMPSDMGKQWGGLDSNKPGRIMSPLSGGFATSGNRPGMAADQGFRFQSDRVTSRCFP